MALQQTKFLRLDFDPSRTEYTNGFNCSFEWAVDHENQTKGDWCWAACLSNALTCFGFYVDQKEVVRRFESDHGTPPGATDHRIPAPEDMLALWRAYGFHGAAIREEPLRFEVLAREIIAHGPVQIELWKEGAEGKRHLALICGVREKSGGTDREALVSDPYSASPEWRSYGTMLGTDPLPSGFGEWRRTYVGLEFTKGYLRRFFGRPSSFLAGLVPAEGPGTQGGDPPQALPVASQLSFDPVPDRGRPLRDELSLALYGYQYYRLWSASDRDVERDRQADIKRSLFLFESLQVWRPQSEVDPSRDLLEQLQFYRWHHQIHNSEGPRYYVGAYHFPQLGSGLDRSWRTAWIGERWLAERVHTAIRKMDFDFKERKETVRLALFRRQGVVTLWLESGAHMVVSAPSELESVFPPLAIMTDGELREALQGLGLPRRAQRLQEAKPGSAVA